MRPGNSRLGIGLRNGGARHEAPPRVRGAPAATGHRHGATDEVAGADGSSGFLKGHHLTAQRRHSALGSPCHLGGAEDPPADRCRPSSYPTAGIAP